VLDIKTCHTFLRQVLAHLGVGIRVIVTFFNGSATDRILQGIDEILDIDPRVRPLLPSPVIAAVVTVTVSALRQLGFRVAPVIGAPGTAPTTVTGVSSSVPSGAARQPASFPTLVTAFGPLTRPDIASTLGLLTRPDTAARPVTRATLSVILIGPVTGPDTLSVPVTRAVITSSGSSSAFLGFVVITSATFAVPAVREGVKTASGFSIPLRFDISIFDTLRHFTVTRTSVLVTLVRACTAPDTLPSTLGTTPAPSLVTALGGTFPVATSASAVSAIPDKVDILIGGVPLVTAVTSSGTK